MIKRHNNYQYYTRHRVIQTVTLCLFCLCLTVVYAAPRKKTKPRPVSERVFLNHSDELKYDQFGSNPTAQILKGHVSFTHQGANLTCDSAYFFQESNSVKAFGHVRYRQSDTLSLNCDYAYYDGQSQTMQARNHVVLRHRRQVLNTDSLNYDRIYNNAYFFEGGTMVDGKDKLVSDWGQYNTSTRQADFYYNVKLRSGKDLITTDTLHYDIQHSKAHIVGPSRITSGSSIVNTQNGYYDTKKDQAQLFDRSTLEDQDKKVTGDSLYYVKNGESEGFGRVEYVDKKNKNSLNCGYLRYNEKTGRGFATRNALAKEYSQGQDTLFVHADTMRIETFNINTDSVIRVVHAYPHVKAYRTDVQAISDSLVFNSKDSCMTMYRDPIVWNGSRQLLGEKIMVYMGDSTIRMAHVVGQAMSVELMPDQKHYNQVSSKEMKAYFDDGKIRMGESYGNVQLVYYPQDDKDSSLIGLNYTETDTLRMFMGSDRRLQKIWMPKATGTLYPMTQIPPAKLYLPGFAWFDSLRPTDKTDVFQWRGKSKGEQLKVIKRHDAPLQYLTKQPDNVAASDSKTKNADGDKNAKGAAR